MGVAKQLSCSGGAYLVSAFQKGWVYNWDLNGWRKADKKPVENTDKEWVI